VTEPEVRRATPGDAARLAELRYAFRVGLREPAEPREAFVSRCAAWMRARLAATGEWSSWVAVQGGAITGTVWVQRVEKLPNPVGEGELHAYITNLFVIPEARGGTGSALLAKALAEADAAGADATYLWPTERSRGLYRRFGFSGEGEVMVRHRPTEVAPAELHGG
jgi:ribosomal protein S18 acetylase RimI-like enzyme